MRKIWRWIFDPPGFSVVVTILTACVVIVGVYAFILEIALFSANLERLILDEQPILPVVPIDSLSRLIESFGNVFEVAARWSGIFTLLAAIYAGRKALQVSNHRKQEAEAAEFRDSMKWAAEHINLDATDPQEVIQSNWALSLIEKYVDNPPPSLSDYDREMAEQLLEEIAESSAFKKNLPSDS